MKKLLMMMFCVMMAIAVAGCGGTKKEAAKETAKAPEKVLTVATDANFPPYEFYQEKTQLHTGFDIGLMRALAEEMGYEKVEFVNVDFKNILTGLSEKKYDAAIAAISVQPDRQKIVDFTEPYIQGAYKIVVKKGSKFDGSLVGKTVAVEEGSYTEQLAKAQKVGKIVAVKNLEGALLIVAAEGADCAIGSAAASSFFIAHNYGDKVEFADVAPLETDDVAIAVAKGNTELQSKFNAALKEIKRNGKYKAVYGSYFGDVK